MNENIKAGGDIHAGDGGYSIGTKEKYDEFVKNRNRMNERIKELEKQCWSHRVDGVLVDGHLHFDTQKFAVLIVRECLSYAKDGDIDFMKFMIKKHFGVAEREE